MNAYLKVIGGMLILGVVLFNCFVSVDTNNVDIDLSEIHCLTSANAEKKFCTKGSSAVCIKDEDEPAFECTNIGTSGQTKDCDGETWVDID